MNLITESGSIAYVTIFNSGNIFVGNDSVFAEFMGNAVIIAAGNGVSNVTITNTQGANMIGGNGSFSDEGVLSAGNGISIVDQNISLASINNITINNSGNILGGNENSPDFTSGIDTGNLIGSGIVIAGLGPISNININNTASGVIQGGNDTDTGGSFSGVGIGIGAINTNDEDTGNNLSGVTVMNAGQILGGNNNGDDFDESELSGYEVGTGIAIVGGTNVSNVTIVNAPGGSILGGNDSIGSQESSGNGIDISNFFGGTISNVSILNQGKIAGGSANDSFEFAGVGVGIDGEFIKNVSITNDLGATIAGGNGNFEDESFDASSGIAFDAETINGVNITNWGLIRGGNDGDTGNTGGGDGIDISASVMNNVTINNGFTGVITGGVGGGDGIFIDPGSNALPAGANVTINNFGVIAGGNGDSFDFNTDAGTGIVYRTEDDAPALVVNNFGWIQGGNGTFGGDGGEGIAIEASNNVINNWGIIAGGANSAQLLDQVGVVHAAVTTDIVPSGIANHGNAIDISGDNNVVNLNGHSAVYGKISLSGANNVVNLNFTGVNVATLNALNAQLHSQGVGSGSDTPSVIFTLRGVTYDIDPAMVNGHLLSYQLQGVTPNQAAVGAALDTALVNPTPGSALFKLYNAIDQSGNVPHALEELSPQPYQIYDDIALANANLFSLTIDHRLSNLRDGSEGIDVSGIGGDQTMGLTSGLSKEDGKGDGKGVITPAGPEHRWGFFASGNAIFTNIDAHGGDLQNAGFTTEGLMLGVDGKIYDKWLVGAFFDYEHTDTDLDNQGSAANIDSYSGGLYAGYHNGGYYGNGLMAYTRNNYDSHRNILIPGFNQSAAGSTSGNQFELNLDGGYDFTLNDRLTWGPIAGMQYVHLGVDGFTENGAPAANLAVGSQDVNSLRSRMGVKVDYHKQISKKMVFATELSAQWQHEFLDDSRGISASFIGDGLAPFSVQTTSPQRDAALLGLGANVTVKDKYTFFFDYDVQAGQQSYLEQSVKGGIKISW